MAGLCWMVVVVAFSLSIGNSVAVDQNRLIERVKDIDNKYSILNMQSLPDGKRIWISLAANILVDQNKVAIDADDPEDVKKTVIDNKVYVGTNVVAARFKKGVKPNKKEYTDHAEYRVLENIKSLVASSKGNDLIFYSYLSPCGAKCTNKDHRFNILDKLKKAISDAKWNEVAFVFSIVFDRAGGKTIDEKDIKGSLKNLGGSVGQDNIFRCYTPNKSVFTCIKCFINGNLAKACFKN